MSLLIDSLRRYWLPDIANAETALTLTLSDWVKTGRFYVGNVDSSTTFRLQLTSVADVADLFAATSNRTMCSCFESIASISEIRKVPRSIAWLIIKLYYSAFFGAHGHMRACGVSCANLDATDAVRIVEAAKLQGVAGSVSKINSGQYLLRFDASTLSLFFTAIQTNGSHEALWLSYKSFLEGLAQQAPDVILIQQQRELLVDKIKSVINLLSLKGSNGGNWLSKVRNLVQYRQTHGVWYPYSIDRSVPAKLITRTISTFKSDPDGLDLAISVGKDAAEIETFYMGCLFISSVARETVLDMAARSSVKGSVARRGAVTFLKLCELD